MSLKPENRALLVRLVPFLVAAPENRARFDLTPFGVEIAEWFDPLRLASMPFLDVLKRLDQVTFGPVGMPMPRWIFVNGAELTGGVVGFGVPRSRVPEATAVLLRVPRTYQGLVPYSMFVATPTYAGGEWLGHNLASLNAAVDDPSLRGLGGLTKAVGLKVFRARTQVGVTQWGSRALRVHGRLGPLEFLTAWTPAHSEPWSLTYRAGITEASLRHLARDPGGRVEPRAATDWVASDDHPQMQSLQAELEHGARFAIVGIPVSTPGGQRVPIRRLGCDQEDPASRLSADVPA